MRAEVIRRKELRRLMQAEQRRKDLQDKLAEQGKEYIFYFNLVFNIVFYRNSKNNNSFH